MYQIVIGIQIFSILLIFIECWVVFKNLKSPLHAYLFMGCISMLINNIGYLMELLSRDEGAYFTALKMSYLGRVWICFWLWMFIAELVHIKIPRVLKIILVLSCISTYIAVATTKITGLYYAKDSSFYLNGQFPVFVHKNEIWHNAWNLILSIIIFSGLAMLFNALAKEKIIVVRNRLLTVILAIITLSVSFLMEITKIIPGTEIYDETMLGFPIAAILILISIFRFNLLDTASLARDYVVDELSEAIIAIDPNGRLRYYNKPALTLFPGLKDNPAKTLLMLKKAVKTEEPLELENRIYSVSLNTLSFRKRSVGELYSLSDDTDHYNYMAQLEDSKKRADSANKAKSSFLAKMSHEIRTPINAILGMDEMILRESTEKDIRSYAADIQMAGRTLLSIINDILDFSKIEEGRMEIIPTQYELSSVVNDLVNMVRDRAEKKGLLLEASVNPQVPHILYGDEIRIKQVALNLLTNAVKYTEKGEVRLSVDFEKKSEDGISLKFTISDTGIGMKKEDMDKLFSPFTRIEEKRNRSIEGTGLGMNISAQLLELMNSRLDVDSEYGKGTRVSFDVDQKVISWEPMGDVDARFEKETGERPSYKELFHAPSARILVVDDTEVNLTVMRNLLKKTRIVVDTATSGMEAVQLSKSNDYDMIFIDHMMPDMDGIETLHRMMESDAADKTVYIALTANAVSGAREMYLDAGFLDYMSKPVDGRRLEEAIRKYLPKDKLQEPHEEDASDDVSNKATDIPKVLVVDDDEVICTATAHILGGSFDVISCRNGKDAVSVAMAQSPQLILLDINLAGINGFDVLADLKREPQTSDIPVMFITADEDRDKEVLGLKSGALDFIRKPVIPEVLLQRTKRIVTLDRYQKDLQGEVRKQTGRAERLSKEMMLALSETVDAKDHYTNGHSERVAKYSAELARRLGKNSKEQERIYAIALLHDIGKIGVSEEIINKTERLTDEEFAQIKKHTVIGNEILKGIVDLPELCLGARSHHERYGGGGYPDGLKGDEIPEVARIICVADCYDAMTSTRTYSDPKPQAVVRAEIERCSGVQFDPRVAKAMLSMIDDDKDFIMNERAGAKGVWKGKAKFWDFGVVPEAEIADYASKSREGSAPTTQGPRRDNLLKEIEKIPEIDIDQGILNCGSADSFLSVLEVFHQTAPQKADEIEELFSQGDIEGYTIKVHALKGSARVIGALELSNMAKELEAAGKAGDKEMIERDTKALLQKYRELDKALSIY